MDRFADIKKRLIEFACADGAIKAAAAIGSSVRDDVKADEYSDLDLIIVSEEPEKWYSGEYPKRLGDVSISFIEPTLGGGKERRCVYDGDRDVDMIIFTQAQFEEALKTGEAGWVMNRGYKLFYGEDLYKEMIEQYVEPGHSHPEMTAEEFENIVNDFYFHNIWAAKKLMRGELWSAKMCVDAYLKQHLLKMIELYCYEKEAKDVWHDGRFIDSWAGEDIVSELKGCFAHYEKNDVLTALKATGQLFERVTREIAAARGYSYPERAAGCAGDYLENCGQKEQTLAQNISG